MLFKVDENLPEELAADLRLSGHDAHACHTEGLQGAADPAVFARVCPEQRVLITFDLDFSDIRIYAPGTHSGIILFRLRQQDIDSVKAAMRRVLADIPMDDLIGNLVIVEELRIRIRRIP